MVVCGGEDGGFPFRFCSVLVREDFEVLHGGLPEAPGGHIDGEVVDLHLRPTLSSELKDSKWNRLERRVVTMLLNPMPRAVRDDAVAHRVVTVAGALFPLHVLYAPGRVAERTAVLKQLDCTPGTDNVVDMMASLI